MSDQVRRMTAAIKAEVGRQLGAKPLFGDVSSTDWHAVGDPASIDLDLVARAAVAALTLPDYGPARPMETAPRDGTRILVLAEVASSRYENALNGAVIVRWSENAAGLAGWELSPSARCTHLDGEPTGWWPLPEQTR